MVMFEDKIRKNLKEDEGIIEIVRNYPLVFTIPTTIATACIIASFFLLFPLLRQGWWGIIIFFALLGFGIILAVRTFIIYTFNVFVITNQRIIDIDQRGFFDRTVSETTYDKIQDVSFRIKGVSQTMFHYGSVIIQTASSNANIELNHIKDPEKVQQLIARINQDMIVQQKKKDDEKLSAAELLKMVQKIKEGLSDEEIQKLIEKDDNKQSNKDGEDL